MNYEQCLSYLDRLGNEVLTMRFGLETIRRLLEALENPHLKFPSVLVAGTNGKGSVARFLSSICTVSGIRTGLFTSPHLVHLEERICLNQRPIDREVLAGCFTRVIETVARLGLPAHPTYFETLTATAFLYFHQAPVELAILEIGMGGRLDSTNVVEPLLTVITPVGLDHQQYLGDTLGQIAREKSGILRSGVPLVLSPQQAESLEVILKRASELSTPVTLIETDEISLLDSCEGSYRFQYRGIDARLSARGTFQVENAAVAIEAARLLRSIGFSIQESSIQNGLSIARTPGCLQKIVGFPSFFVDGGHNPDAARQLARFVQDHTRPPRALVTGMMRDKDIGGIFQILEPLFQTVWLVGIGSPRAATVPELQSFCPRGIPCESPMKALDEALRRAPTVVAAGSFYLAGEILRNLGEGEFWADR